MWLYLLETAESDLKINFSGFNHLIERLLLESAFFLKIVIESVALLILSIAVLQAIKKILISRRKIRQKVCLNSIRIELGTSLALALELLLAADIVATAVSATWQSLGQLAAIAGIRTFLNFFLEKEVKELEENK